MILTVVDKFHDVAILSLPIEVNALNTLFDSVGVLETDAVSCRFVAVGNLEVGPGARNARIELESSSFQLEAKNRFEGDTVKPGRRPGLPGPATATIERRLPVDIASDDIGLDAVTGHLFRR